jgi:hypothetical protein
MALLRVFTKEAIDHARPLVDHAADLLLASGMRLVLSWYTISR